MVGKNLVRIWHFSEWRNARPQAPHGPSRKQTHSMLCSSCHSPVLPPRFTSIHPYSVFVLLDLHKNCTPSLILLLPISCSLHPALDPRCCRDARIDQNIRAKTIVTLQHSDANLHGLPLLISILLRCFLRYSR